MWLVAASPGRDLAQLALILVLLFVLQRLEGEAGRGTREVCRPWTGSRK